MSTLNIATFNVRGLSKRSKQQQLRWDMAQYGVDICAIQETKMKDGIEMNIDGYELKCFESKQKAYGNGFLVSPRFAPLIHKYWRVSDRISVMQFNLRNDNRSNNRQWKYSYKLCKPNVTVRFQRKDPKYVLTVINVYAPTSQRAASNPDEVHEMYEQLNSVVQDIDNKELLIIAGDFNSKIGKATDIEQCMGKYSRNRRNNNGEHLIQFCELNNLFISNTAFRHRAKHITTHTRTYKDPNSQEMLHSYSQIDFILIPRQLKHLLTNSRSYAGTQTFSDHKMVVTRMTSELYQIYKVQTDDKSKSRKFDVQKLQDPNVRKAYQDSLATKFNEQPNMEWEKMKEMIISTAEEQIGYQKKGIGKRKCYSTEIENLSKRSRDMHVQMSNTAEQETYNRLRQERNVISHEIRRLVRKYHDSQIIKIVDRIENAPNSLQMFQAVKDLNRKSLKPLTVHDHSGKSVSAPNAVCNLITQHFQTHFNDENVAPIPQMQIGRMRAPIRGYEVKKASNMTNNRATGCDNMNAELVKYAPSNVHDGLARILTDTVETGNDIGLGQGLIAPLEKPNKPMPRPAKDLRPVCLLPVIRKILSKVGLNRCKDKIDQYLPLSQAAYRNNRSTTDVVWSYKWLIAKASVYKIKILSTGIDMSAAFDTIHRNKLIQICENVFDADETKIVQVLLNHTTLEVKMPAASNAKRFSTNVGSPQGDSFSGPLFNMYFENALQGLRADLNPESSQNSEHNYAVNVSNLVEEHDYCKHPRYRIPTELQYADDADFLTTSVTEDERLNEIAVGALQLSNLKVNKDKTERIVIERKEKDQEMWRHSKKVGSLLGDTEDMLRRKVLTNAAMKKLEKIWLNGSRVRLTTRVKLLDSMVMHVLKYNSLCWALRKSDISSLNAFHRRLLRRICKIHWPNRITNKKLYKLTKTIPLTVQITKARWRYLGHVLRMDPESPPHKAMLYYFASEPCHVKKHSGGKRCTIHTTLQNDIKDTLSIFNNFQIKTFDSWDDMITIRKMAQERGEWKGIVKTVSNAAQAKNSFQ